MATAAVIGSGPNGLVGAIILARAGLAVSVYEAHETLGGGMRSAQLTLPGFVHDVCSAIHPLARASPVFRGLDLPVEWIDPPAAAAHPLDDGSAVVLERDPAETARSLGPDGCAYRSLVDPVLGSWDEAVRVLLGPHPLLPDRLVALARALGPVAAATAFRDALADARSLARRRFRGERARAFLAGHAAHSMLPLERRPSGGFGVALAALGHAVGWPLARGGSQTIADALAAELFRLGGTIATSTRVDELPHADVVLADVAPRELLRLAGARLPPAYANALHRYRHGPGAFKVDWALDGPIPWRAPECARAGTVHVGGSFADIAASESASWGARAGARPFVLVSQPTLFDDSRAPPGKHTAWAYCHVPNGSRADMTDAIEGQVERFAPGFGGLVLARRTAGPGELEKSNRNYVGGDINCGAMDLGQLLFRPVRSRAPYRTPLDGVYLCSAATPPGGGVHGMCGYAAARLALRDLASR